MSAPFKRCSCGAHLSRVDWESLPFVGIGGDDVERLDLRNHTCGSTIAMVLPDGVSVCAQCHTWIENETKTVTRQGDLCSECGPWAAREAAAQ